VEYPKGAPADAGVTFKMLALESPNIAKQELNMKEKFARMASEVVDAIDGPEMVQIGWVVLAWPESMTMSKGKTLLLRLPALVEQEVIDDYIDSLEGVIPDEIELEERQLEKAAWAAKVSQRPDGKIKVSDTDDAIVEEMLSMFEGPGVSLYSLGSRERAFRSVKRRSFFLISDTSGGGIEDNLYFSWRTKDKEDAPESRFGLDKLVAVIAEQRINIPEASFSNRMFTLVFSDGIDDEQRREKVLFGQTFDETHFFVKGFTLLKERLDDQEQRRKLVGRFIEIRNAREEAELEAAMAAGLVSEEGEPTEAGEHLVDIGAADVIAIPDKEGKAEKKKRGAL
jgi:hypothetical protein